MYPFEHDTSYVYIVVVVVVVVVLTSTHNTMQSVVAGQAPITLEWKKYLGSKTEAKAKKEALIGIPPRRTPGKKKGD